MAPIILQSFRRFTMQTYLFIGRLYLMAHAAIKYHFFGKHLLVSFLRVHIALPNGNSRNTNCILLMDIHLGRAIGNNLAAIGKNTTNNNGSNNKRSQPR